MTTALCSGILALNQERPELSGLQGKVEAS